MKKEEVFFRRRQVWHYYTQGYNQLQIADKLNVSAKTVQRDFQMLRKEAIEWFNTLRYGQIQLHHKSNFDSNQKVIFELWQLYEGEKDEDKKLKILNMISHKTEISSKMLSNEIYPTNCERW